MAATIELARSTRLAAAASLMVLVMAGAGGPVALAQTQAVPGAPTEGQNRYGDFRDEQGQGRTGDIRDDAKALGREIREGASSVVEGARNLVDGDEEQEAAPGRDTRRGQASRRVTSDERAARAACAESDLDAEAMRELQRELNQLWGSNGPSPGAVDGLCGPRTVASIRAFQAAQGMEVDGVPRRSLVDRLRDVAEGPAPAATGTTGSMTSAPAAPQPSGTSSTEGTSPPPAPAGAMPEPMPPATGATGAVGSTEPSAATAPASGSSALQSGTPPGTMEAPPASEASVPGSPPGSTPAPGTTDQSTLPGQPVTPTTPSAPASPLPTTTDPATGQPR
jgi:peptidoglycan hydrolase-like protein with peptidoglycan-binding domain